MIMTFKKTATGTLFAILIITATGVAQSEVDLKLPAERQKHQQSGQVILINRFTTPQGEQQKFIDAQTAEYKRLDGKVKGSISVKLHKGTDGKTVVNYAVFATETDYHNWVKSELFKDHLDKIKHLVTKAEPLLFEVVYEKSEAGTK